MSDPKAGTLFSGDYCPKCSSGYGGEKATERNVTKPMNPEPVRCALYGRVSTDRQATGTQEVRGKEYIEWKWGKGTQPAVEFYDADVSGSIPMWNRPGGRQLRARLLSNRNSHERIQHLVVTKLDRLGRSAIDLLTTLKFLDGLKIVLHVVDMGGDSLSTQGPSGRLMFHVLAGMAEYERELITGRIRDRLAVKRANNELCGTVPYGWDAIETGEVTGKGVKVRRLQDNPGQQHWILIMHKLRQAGWSYGAIAKHLNANGCAPKRSKGEIIKHRGEARFVSGRWQQGNVCKVLSNQTVQSWLVKQVA